MANKPKGLPRLQTQGDRIIEGFKDGDNLKKTTVWIPEDLWDRMAVLAYAQKRTASGLLREFIVDGLKKREGHNGLFG